MEQERSVSSFSFIKLSDGIDLYLRQGTPGKLIVKAEENRIDNIQTEVEGNTLVVKLEKRPSGRWSWNRAGARVYVTVDDLRGIKASGGSDVFSEMLNLKALRVDASGGSDLELKLDVDELQLELSGGSDTGLEGTARMMEVQSSGGSDLDARDFRVVDCTVDSSGGSDVHIFVTGKLEIEASGASDVSYRGNPKELRQKTSGGADVRGN